MQIVVGDEKIHTSGPGQRLRRDEQSHLLSPVREFGEPRRRRPCRLLTEHLIVGLEPSAKVASESFHHLGPVIHQEDDRFAHYRYASVPSGPR